MDEESSPVEQKSDPISIENIQNVICKLSEMEESFGEVTKGQEETESWMFLKSIDLTKALDAIVYRAKIDNKLCDVKMILSSVEYGFSQLLCTQCSCYENAIMWHKNNNDNPAELYCEEHSNSVDPSSEGQFYLDSELKKDRKALKSLERLLVVVQEQMEYLNSKNTNKDMVTYTKIKEKLEEEYGDLKNTLNEMTVKAKQITANKTKASKANKYEPLSFVMSDSDKWIKSILGRLLVVVQEQMEYLNSKNTNKDMVTYTKIKEKLEEEYGDLKNTLNEMTVKAKQITANKTKASKANKYEPLSFVMSDSDKWIKSILGLLRLIFEANIKPEIEAKLKAILNWSAGIEKYKEETKSSSVYSIPDEIYGQEFELCKIPTQTFKKIKELEERVQNLAKAAIAYQMVKLLF